MLTSDFDYELPGELIAQQPATPRDSCRLMVLDKRTGEIGHEVFSQIIDYLEPGDLLVANETRVMPARLNGNKVGTGGACEFLLLKQVEPDIWECLVKPGKRLREGARVEFRAHGAPPDSGTGVLLLAEVVSVAGESGERTVRFTPASGTLDEAFHTVGTVPLPPYITQYSGDDEMYQTVYSKSEASAAAPTAGLHFTPELIERIEEKGIGWETVDLEVGVDTFRIVTEEHAEDHAMHTERYSVSQRVVDAVERAHDAGHRVIAVGTTSTRSLESAWDQDLGRLVARDHATTSLYIMPGYGFHAVDALITNFHVPRSTLMMLVSALAGHDHIMAAYAEAVSQRYRMLSFGDAMFIH